MVFVHRLPCAIRLSFMVYGFMVYLLPQHWLQKEEMLLQSWVVRSIEVEGSAINPKNCMVKGIPEKDTGPEVKLSFSFVTYSGWVQQNKWCVQQGLKLQCSVCFLLSVAELLKAKGDGSRFSCLAWPLVWWHTGEDSRLPRKQSTWKPRGCPSFCTAAGHVTWQAFEPCAHFRPGK